MSLIQQRKAELRDKRIRLKKTQSETAEHMGVARETLNRLECGETVPDGDTLLAWEQTLSFFESEALASGEACSHE